MARKQKTAAVKALSKEVKAKMRQLRTEAKAAPPAKRRRYRVVLKKLQALTRILSTTYDTCDID